MEFVDLELEQTEPVTLKEFLMVHQVQCNLDAIPNFIARAYAQYVDDFHAMIEQPTGEDDIDAES